MSIYEALENVKEIPGIARGAAKIEDFVKYIQTLRSQAEFFTVQELLNTIIETTGYVKELQAEGTDEARARIENIDELISKVVSYEESTNEPSLSGFLEEVALVADIDDMDEGSEHVMLMTLHSAKGLEFPNVYLTGMEEGIFPGYVSISSGDPDDIEEERRLCYVGITRAMRHLTISCAKQRMIRGQTQYNAISRFLREIPMELINTSTRPVPGTPRSASPQGFAQSSENSNTIRKPNNPYAQAKQSFKSKAFDPNQYKVTKPTSLDYSEGDRVKHIKFGEGTVIKIVEGGKDFEVTVDFDRVGVKKMFAAFAKLKKV
ncbi:MAG: 3'-5' exonuclease, partial [Muricoprocola sp.]